MISPIKLLCLFPVIGAAFLQSSIAQAANEAAMLNALRSTLADKPTAMRPALVPGMYALYFNAEQPRAFVDDRLSILGNSSTGYTIISGARRGQDVLPEDAQRLFKGFVGTLPKNRLITYRFGNGQREVYLITAYDCPACRQLEKRLADQAASLNATVYVIPTALAYSVDPQAKETLRSVLCAKDRAQAWQRLAHAGVRPTPRACDIEPDDYAFLSRLFPVRFPLSVPTAVTTDGQVFPFVMAKFDEIFRNH